MGTLTGQRIVVTRAAHQAEELAGPLRELGADVILLPTIGIAPPLDPAPLLAAAANCDEYDWIVFTSSNAIEAFAAQLARSAASCKARVATVGAATRQAAEQCGFAVTMTPEKYVAESLLDSFASEDLRNCRILIPSAAVTRDVLATGLCQRGAAVTVVEAYRNVIPADAKTQAPMIFRNPYPHWVTFTSSSAIENLTRLVGAARLQYLQIATIGPVTSESVRRQGLNVAIEATPHTIAGIILALCA